MDQRGWTTVRGGRRDKTDDTTAPRPVSTTKRYNWRNDSCSVPNDGGGDCWWLGVLQAYLIAEGVAPRHAQLALTTEGKTSEQVDQLEVLASLIRSLTVEAFRRDNSEEIRWGFDQPQTAFTDAEIEEMALTLNRDVRNETDWINSILFPGGLGDERAALLLAKVLCIPNFALVKPVVCSGDRVLRVTEGNTNSTDGKNMVMIHAGHYEAVAPKYVSLTPGAFCLVE